MRIAASLSRAGRGGSPVARTVQPDRPNSHLIGPCASPSTATQALRITDNDFIRLCSTPLASPLPPPTTRLVARALHARAAAPLGPAAAVGCRPAGRVPPGLLRTLAHTSPFDRPDFARAPAVAALPNRQRSGKSHDRTTVQTQDGANCEGKAALWREEGFESLRARRRRSGEPRRGRRVVGRWASQNRGAARRSARSTNQPRDSLRPALPALIRHSLLTTHYIQHRHSNTSIDQLQ